MDKCCEFCGRGIEGFKRNTRKYCDDNCKQLAYYARRGMTWGKDGLSGKSNLSLNIKSNFTLSDKSQADSGKESFVVQQIIAPQTEKQMDSIKPTSESRQNALVRRSYRKVESALLTAIERNREGIEKYFCSPDQYWTSNAISNVKWVTIRVRCLLENILRLSNLGKIDRQAIKQLSAAMRDLSESEYFRYLPANYPFIEFIHELSTKFHSLTQQVTARQISFRLSTERKAQFMAYRFVIAGFVPKCKFSGLDFSEGIMRGYEKEFATPFQNGDREIDDP